MLTPQNVRLMLSFINEECSRRRHSSSIVLALVGCVLATLVNCASGQQPYPSKAIRVVVPLVPGGSTDNVARIVADKMRESFAQPVIVENRPGGNSSLGTEAVARAAPDGYTLLIQSGTHVVLPFVEHSLRYDPLKDFAPVASLASTRYVMLVHPSVPAKTLKEFIAFAKARPGQINFASSGSASGSRIAGEVFNMLAGVRMQNIPYKGGAQALTDAIGGHVHVSYNSPAISAPHINSGRLRGLAISGNPRLPLLSQVPTFIEAGLPDYNEMGWHGMFAPVATPRAVVEKLSADISRILAAPDLRDRFEKQALEPFDSTPERFAAMLKAETAKLDKLVKTANIKFEI
jgi:tripartite-type tricarboxylate transporter receptor subunit TctC